MAMEWTITVAALGLGALGTAFCAWKSGRPRKDSLKPRWISWRLMTLFSGAVTLVALAHTASMLGLNQNSGRPY